MTKDIYGLVADILPEVLEGAGVIPTGRGDLSRAFPMREIDFDSVRLSANVSHTLNV